jgi:hypothetical protein
MMSGGEMSFEEVESGLRRADDLLNACADTLADHGKVRPAAAIRELTEDPPDPTRMWTWIFSLSDQDLELVKAALQEAIVGTRMKGLPDATRVLMEVHTACSVVQKSREES